MIRHGGVWGGRGGHEKARGGTGRHERHGDEACQLKQRRLMVINAKKGKPCCMQAAWHDHITRDMYRIDGKGAHEGSEPKLKAKSRYT